MGRLEAALAAEGLLDDTIFVYTSDHGDMLGSQGVQRKQHPWDESILVPFLLRGPGQAGRGRRISFPLNVVDILPTLLGLAGVPIPATVEGRDLSPAVRGEPFAGNESALHHVHRAVRGVPRRSPGAACAPSATATPAGSTAKASSYDTLADPDQLHNRYRQSDWRGLRGDLEDLLQQHLAQRGDRFLPAAAYLEQYGYASR